MLAAFYAFVGAFGNSMNSDISQSNITLPKDLVETVSKWLGKITILQDDGEVEDKDVDMENEADEQYLSFYKLSKDQNRFFKVFDLNQKDRMYTKLQADALKQSYLKETLNTPEFKEEIKNLLVREMYDPFTKEMKKISNDCIIIRKLNELYIQFIENPITFVTKEIDLNQFTHQTIIEGITTSNVIPVEEIKSKLKYCDNMSNDMFVKCADLEMDDDSDDEEMA